VDQVGIHDNFFDLGGHSLLLIKIHARLRREVDSDLAVVDLFRYPTIEALAASLERRYQAAAVAEGAIS
jgi:aryl carrier-like protein